MANILAIQKGLAERVRARRREGKISQAELAGRSGVSLASVRRFETTGEVSLVSLVRIAAALGYEQDFANLFARKNYRSLDEIIKANKNAK
jgi:transcriptional regulator with XRE-family HTH domain